MIIYVCPDFASQGISEQAKSNDLFQRGNMSHSDAEMLRSDPLKNFAHSAASSSSNSVAGQSKTAAPGATAWSVPNEGREVPGKNGKIERRMFEWDEVFRNGEEWSFEEIRARRAGLLGSVGREVRDWEMQWHAPGGQSGLPIARPSTTR